MIFDIFFYILCRIIVLNSIFLSIHHLYYNCNKQNITVTVIKKNLDNSVSSIYSTTSNQCDVVHLNNIRNNTDPSMTNIINALEAYDLLITQTKGHFCFNKHLTKTFFFRTKSIQYLTIPKVLTGETRRVTTPSKK